MYSNTSQIHGWKESYTFDVSIHRIDTYSIQSSVRSHLESLDSVLMQITCGPEIFIHKKLDYVWVLYYKLSDLISELVSFL